jgi:hypothetical protein
MRVLARAANARFAAVKNFFKAQGMFNLDPLVLHDLTQYVTLLREIGTSLAGVIVGAWVLWKFIIRREAHPKIQFILELNNVGSVDDKLLVEVVAIVENKGLVRHRLDNFQFDLRYLLQDEKIVEGEEKINFQIAFDHTLPTRSWIPRKWEYTFVDPGVMQRYSYLAWLPADAAFALIYAHFRYPDAASEFHTAQKVFRIEQSQGPNTTLVDATLARK